MSVSALVWDQKWKEEKMRLLLPKTYVPETELQGAPLFFLGGPIRQGGDWQCSMSVMLEKAFGKHVVIANPSRYESGHMLYRYRLRGIETKFDRQLTWERHYLDYAALGNHDGCIMFYLAEQKDFAPREDGSPYAMDTRGELGEWRGRMIHEKGIRLILGAEKGFPGLSQIQRNFNFALKREFRIYHSMEAMVNAALAKQYS